MRCLVDAARQEPRPPEGGEPQNQDLTGHSVPRFRHRVRSAGAASYDVSLRHRIGVARSGVFSVRTRTCLRILPIPMNR